jgi:hypothetical protein
MVGMTAINFLMPEVDRTRVDLNCASPDDITDGTKLLCLVVDATIIYWIILIFSILLGALTSRMAM